MIFEEQIMSKYKYSSIFSKSNRGYCVQCPSNFFATRAVLEIGDPVLAGYNRSRGVFRPIARERKKLMDHHDSEYHQCFPFLIIKR